MPVAPNGRQARIIAALLTCPGARTTLSFHLSIKMEGYILDLNATSALLRLLSDPTRMRLLALLEREELTVAELSTVLRLAQPRVSTHLAKLKESVLLRDPRAGVAAYYRLNTEPGTKTETLMRALHANLEDSLLVEDAARLPGVLAQRADVEGWADSVAGDMERHYSPGRTWEALARAMT